MSSQCKEFHTSSLPSMMKEMLFSLSHPKPISIAEGFPLHIDDTTEKGYTFLMLAVCFHHPQEDNLLSLIRTLITKKADLNHQNKNGETALMISCSKPMVDLNLVRVLLEAKSHVDLQDQEGTSALMIAGSCMGMRFGSDHQQVFDLLIGHKASIDQKNKYRLSVLDCVIVFGNDTDTITHLLMNGASFGSESTVSLTTCFRQDKQPVLATIMNFRGQHVSKLKSSIPLPYDGGHHLLHNEIFGWIHDCVYLM